MPTIMLEIPTALKPMLEPLRKLVSAVQRQVERSQAGSRDVKYEGFEETLDLFGRDRRAGVRDG